MFTLTSTTTIITDITVLEVASKRYSRNCGTVYIPLLRNFGRNKNKVNRNLRKLRDKLPDIIRGDKFRTTGFDTLALDQLNIRNLLSDDEWNILYQGEEGSFTFLVDLVKNQFARNSSETDVLYGINNLSVVDMFNIVRGDKIETA